MSISLLLDTSSVYLYLGLLVDGQLIDQVSEKAPRQQSEITMGRIQELFRKHQLSPRDLDTVVLSEGPGSYTGIRIAMTIAKVLGSLAQVQVYTLNTLQIACGQHPKKRLALLDARSQRAYVAIYQNGQVLLEPQILQLDQIKSLLSEVDEVVGDGHLIDQETVEIDFIQNMIELKNQWNLVDQIDDLVPLYLKQTSSYGNHST